MKKCKQKEHEWEFLKEKLPLFRYKCSICGCIGKIYKKKGILPLKDRYK